jgi:ABC-type amino acid transport system permease subunit
MQVYVLAAIFYIVVNTLLALLGRMMERRLGSVGR